MEALSPEDRDAVLELLFDDENGIGFDWGRIPMGPSDYAVDRYSLSESPGSFDLTRDTRYLIPYIKAAQAVNSDIRFWASPWTPPLWAKTGPSEYGGYDKGSFDPGYSQEYADYFVNWIDAYEQQGIPIDHVQPQNEPGFSQSYPTAAFGPAFDTELNEDVYTDQPVTLGAFVNDYLYPALQASKYKTDLWFGTLSNDKFFSTYWDSLPDKSQVLGSRAPVGDSEKDSLFEAGRHAGDADRTPMRQLSLDEESRGHCPGKTGHFLCRFCPQQPCLCRGVLGFDQILDRRWGQYLQCLEHGAR